MTFEREIEVIGYVNKPHGGSWLGGLVSMFTQ